MPSEQTKVCRSCHTRKPLSEFQRDAKTADGRRGTCKTCRSAQTRWKHRSRPRLYWSKRLSHLRCNRHKTHEWEITVDDLMALWDEQGGRCALSGVKMTRTVGEGRVATNASIDRIDSSRGYTRDNVQLVCTCVNMMKGDLTEKDLTLWCLRVLKHSSKTKTK